MRTSADCFLTLRFLYLKIKVRNRKEPKLKDTQRFAKKKLYPKVIDFFRNEHFMQYLCFDRRSFMRRRCIMNQKTIQNNGTSLGTLFAIFLLLFFLINRTKLHNPLFIRTLTKTPLLLFSCYCSCYSSVILLLLPLLISCYFPCYFRDIFLELLQKFHKKARQNILILTG